MKQQKVKVNVPCTVSFDIMVMADNTLQDQEYKDDVMDQASAIGYQVMEALRSQMGKGYQLTANEGTTYEIKC